MKKLLFTLCLLLAATSLPAQKLKFSSEAEREAKYRSEMIEKLALDYSMPDYSTKKIDANVMGPHLATMVNILLQNCGTLSYSKWLSQILGEQVEPLKYQYLGIKKMKFVDASKQGNDISLLFNVWLKKNPADVKQTEMTIRFIDGLSDSKTVNELFSLISSYGR